MTTAALGVQAAGLGRLNLMSGLGQPLRAEIDLTSVARDEAGSLTAKLAGADAFNQANIEYGSALSGLRFSIQRRANGQPYVLVTSNQIVNEPYLDLLVELTWSSGRLVREYTMLLDPPESRAVRRETEPAVIVQAQTPASGASAPASSRVTTSSSSTTTSADTAVAAPRARRTAPRVDPRIAADSREATGGEYRVQPGDTAISIARSNKPESVSLEQMLAALYLNHPYHHPTIGWRHEMETLDREDALAFYRRFYAPNNAILIVAGDVTADEVKALAEQTYGKVERQGVFGPRLRPQEPPPIAPRQVSFADPRVTQPSLQRSYLVPSHATAKAGEADALDVLAHALGGGSNSLLYRALVVDKKVATGAGAWYSGTSLDVTRFGVYATPAPGVSLAKAEAALDDVIAEFLESGATTEVIERSKNRLIADFVYAQDNQGTLARLYGAALTTGLTLEHVKARPERLRAVTAERVRDVARQFLDKRRSVTGYLVRDLKDVASREEKRS